MKPLAIGHRGAPRLAPENTLASFEKALELSWIDAVELDVHETKDGRAAVIHDDKLDRTTKAKGFVSERTSAELGSLGVPLLDDVLDLVKARGKRVFIELKMQPRFYRKLPALVAALVREKEVEERSVLISFDHRTLVSLKREAPSLATGALCAQRLHDPARYVKEFLGADWWLAGAMFELDTVGFASATGEVDRRSFEECRAKGVKTALWTLDRDDLVKGALALSVDGIISDEPELLRQLS